MLKLKTRTMLKRNGARLTRINRADDLSIRRSALLSRAVINRHCALYLAAARRSGTFHPPGGARVRGEP